MNIDGVVSACRLTIDLDVSEVEAVYELTEYADEIVALVLKDCPGCNADAISNFLYGINKTLRELHP